VAGILPRVTRPLSAESLLQLPVLLRTIRLGHPTDVVLEPNELRALGLEILCRDGAERFLPLPAARVREDAVAVESPLQLLDADDLAFYRARATTFRALRGQPVERRGHVLGALADLLLATDGAALAALVEADGQRLSLPLERGITIGGRRTPSAA
jgi:hypothetical protein